jgi:predicted neuraminidase
VITWSKHFGHFSFPEKELMSALHRVFPVAFLLLQSAVPFAQTPAPSPSTAMALFEPWVAQRSDGVERMNHDLGTAETYLPILFPSSHAANLLELQNGDILCVWFSGSWEGSSGVGIVVSRRPKGSRNWGPTVLIDNHPGESYQNPVLFQEPNGTIDLYHSTQGADAGEANAHVLHVVSKDNGVTWSNPELQFDKPGAFSRHRVVILPNGSWMLPLTYVISADIGKGSETNYSATEISADQGKSWKECVMDGTLGKIQPTVVSLAPGQLLAFLRSRASDYIYRSSSSDGCAWTLALPTSLPNNDASVQAFCLHDGHIVMAFDNSSVRPGGGNGVRKPLTVALSEDNGKTWPYVRDVEVGRAGFGLAQQKPKEPGREEYSYPSIMQTSEGEILIAFTYRRQTIKVVSFQENWIKHGGTLGQFKGNH